MTGRELIIPWRGQVVSSLVLQTTGAHCERKRGRSPPPGACRRTASHGKRRGGARRCPEMIQPGQYPVTPKATPSDFSSHASQNEHRLVAPRD